MSPQDVRLQDNGACLPDVGQEGWVRKAFREDPMGPPLTPNTMRWMLRGDDLEGLDIYDLVPRKLEERSAGGARVGRLGALLCRGGILESMVPDGCSGRHFGHRARC